MLIIQQRHLEQCNWAKVPIDAENEARVVMESLDLIVMVTTGSCMRSNGYGSKSESGNEKQGEQG